MKTKCNFFSKKTLLILVFITVFIAWVLFPSTLFFGNWNKAFEVKDENGQYTAVVYKKLPISPYAMFKYFIMDDDYFIVLYNKNRYIWKSSQFTTISYGAFSASIWFSDLKERCFYIPNK
ncbi:DUF6201 family protein [Photorhabdus australis]|uniref:DUF6201 family protein n=1 Tax=Photorhabdus australis TaxID=286156 RepID=UPI001F47394E|nr:DUF6201 family protein [Photorhabdus australis]